MRTGPVSQSAATAAAPELAGMRETLLRVCVGGFLIFGGFILLNATRIRAGTQLESWVALSDAIAGVYVAAIYGVVRRARSLHALHLASYALVLGCAANITTTATLRDNPYDLFYLSFLLFGLGAVPLRARGTAIVGGLIASAAIALAVVRWSGDQVVWVAACMVASALLGGAVFVGRARSADALARLAARQAELEDQLRQVQKLDAIGTLAGGVAHDINNVLAAIVGLSEVGVEEHPPGSQVREDFSHILSAAQRGATLTRDLLGFARRGKHRSQPLSLNDAAEEIAEMLARTLPRRVRIQLELDESLGLVAGDPGQLGHVIMNLCLNAADAIPGDGTITVRTHGAQLGEGDSAVLRPGPHVVIEVIDDGVGMDEETLARAFEPFFSTKPARQGRSGLGLAMVYGTIRDHGGEVILKSAPGRGTTAIVRLPQAVGARLPSARPTGNTPPSVEGRVLVIDDEEVMRRMLRRSLRSAGHDTVECESGAAGLEAFGADPHGFAAVVLDLAMPGMTGAECFGHLRALDPEVPIVIISGFPKDQNVERLIAAGAAAFLAKPFLRDDLLAVMRKVRRRRPMAASG